MEKEVVLMIFAVEACSMGMMILKTAVEMVVRPMRATRQSHGKCMKELARDKDWLVVPGVAGRMETRCFADCEEWKFRSRHLRVLCHWGCDSHLGFQVVMVLAVWL